jgi:hypothetical protein
MSKDLTAHRTICRRTQTRFWRRAHRALLPSDSLVKEYDHRDISSIPAIGNTNPADPHQATFHAARGRPTSDCEPARLPAGARESKVKWLGRPR